MEMGEQEKNLKNGSKKATGQGTEGRKQKVLILKRGEEKRENIFVSFIKSLLQKYIYI